MNDLLDPLLLARWQFGITTVYHFLFVPITIGLATTAAVFQTAWYRTGKTEYLRITRFLGTIFLINFAMGVVTGIVQEFQFGMNWSEYSRFVGDVFGAPLAHGGPARVLLRGHVHRALDLRLGQAAARPAPRQHLGGGDRQPSSRRTSSSPRTRSCRTRSATR